MDIKPLPTEIVSNILEILSYAAAALVGWIAKYLQRKNKKNDSSNQ